MYALLLIQTINAYIDVTYVHAFIVYGTILYSYCTRSYKSKYYNDPLNKICIEILFSKCAIVFGDVHKV